MSSKPTYEELEKRIEKLEQLELERKQAEHELAQIFSNALDMICIADINTATFIMVNPAFTEILGYSEEELLKKPFLNFVHPEDINASRNVIDEKLKIGTKVINFENRYQCKDGSYRWLSWVSHPNLNKGVTFSVARDITEWKKNEDALRKSKALLDATGRMAKVGGWELDADTMDVTWTEETYRIHEVPLNHKPPLKEAINFFHPEDRPQLERAIKRALDRGEPYDLEMRFTTARGKHLWTRTICNPEIVNGKTATLKGTFQDITARKQAEESLKQANETLEQRVAERTAELEQRAEQLQQMALDLTRAEDLERRHLAAILHDEFQQDAACIKMELDRLRGGADTDMHHRLANLAKFTGEFIEKMRHLSYTLNPPALHRSGLLTALDVLAKDMQTHHGLAVTLRTQPGAEPVSFTLSSMLYRSVRELLFNVVKHAGVNTAVVDVGGRGKWIRIKVTDHGNGFDYPAIRAGQGSKAAFGLYNIEDRMSFLGGSMHIESRPGKGSCIVLTAPKGILPDSTALKEHTKTAAVKQSEAPEPARPSAMPDDKEKIRILLVEDHKLFRKGLVEMLRDHKELVVVGEADDGEKAIELAAELRPNVIIMDVTMPKLDGVEATARITRNHPDIRIIGLSMHNDDDTRQKMLNVGAEAFLAKTISPDKLIETIRRVHRGFNRSNGSAGQKNKRG